HLRAELAGGLAKKEQSKVAKCENT
ncbi:MAG: hypothetical protein JWQ59_1028, partial [Cryobacterium sp.]|nr:hypothetical protein [Cryobacterium sp.]